jgi:glycerol dehydrogenase
VGLPVTFAGIGLQEMGAEVLRKIARRASVPGETIHNEPFAVAPEMVIDVLMAAYSARERFQWSRN